MSILARAAALSPPWRKRGNIPNPFFDPGFFSKQAPGKRFCEYLRDVALWSLPTSRYFVPSWYLDQPRNTIAPDQNPLHHFWHQGFDAEIDPSPEFSSAFFRRAIARDASDPREYAYSWLLDSNWNVPISATGLSTLQQRFYDTVRLERIKYTEKSKHDSLVFVQAGKDFGGESIFREPPFDVLINFYGEPAPAGYAQFVFRQNGTKVTAIRKLRESFPDLFSRYKAVLFLDDDVEISQDQIVQLFRAQDHHSLDLMQASLSADSSCDFAALKQPTAGRGLRRISGIEIMMPLLSKRTLEQCGWAFKESISGWGVDILLSAEVQRQFGNSIGLLGDVVAAHRRPVDQGTNEFYKYLSRHGIVPTAESGNIEMKLGLEPIANFIHFLNDESR